MFSWLRRRFRREVIVDLRTCRGEPHYVYIDEWGLRYLFDYREGYDVYRSTARRVYDIDEARGILFVVNRWKLYPRDQIFPNNARRMICLEQIVADKRGEWF